MSSKCHVYFRVTAHLIWDQRNSMCSTHVSNGCCIGQWGPTLQVEWNLWSVNVTSSKHFKTCPQLPVTFKISPQEPLCLGSSSPFWTVFSLSLHAWTLQPYHFSFPPDTSSFSRSLCLRTGGFLYLECQSFSFYFFIRVLLFQDATQRPPPVKHFQELSRKS